MIGESGNPICILRPVSASKGDILVEVCGVPRKRRRNVVNWDFQSTLSATEARIVLFSVAIKRSASPFASGQSGVIFL